MVGFLQSQAARGYSPQFLDTGTQAETPMAGGQSPDLINRMLQIMSGQLGGTLTGGEKLSALGALLKSVSRGSQTSPQQVMQSIQQQKLQEVQGALQIQELRKAAAEKAQYDKFRADLIAQATDPQEKAFLAIASSKALDEIAAQRFKGPELSSYGRRLVETYGVKPGSQAFMGLSEAQLGMPTTEVTPTGTITYAGIRPYATSYDSSGKKFIKMSEDGPWLSAE